MEIPLPQALPAPAGSRLPAPGRRHPGRWWPAGVLAFIVLATLLAPWLAPHPPDLLFRHGLGPGGVPLGPSPRFPLGTDQYGRDELSRLLYGGRTALAVSVPAAVLATPTGTAAGLWAGYEGGTADAVVTRLANVLMSFPLTLFAVAMVLIIRPRPLNLVVVLALVSWPYTARLIRAEALALKELPFVEAARSLGAGSGRILLRHLGPNVLPTATARFALNLAQMFLMEASLSYLGVGVQPPTPDWGLMVAQSQSYYLTDPGLVLYPLAAILLTVVSAASLAGALTPAGRGGGQR